MLAALTRASIGRAVFACVAPAAAVGLQRCGTHYAMPKQLEGAQQLWPDGQPPETDRKHKKRSSSTPAAARAPLVNVPMPMPIALATPSPSPHAMLP